MRNLVEKLDIPVQLLKKKEKLKKKKVQNLIGLGLW